MPASARSRLRSRGTCVAGTHARRNRPPARGHSFGCVLDVFLVVGVPGGPHASRVAHPRFEAPLRKVFMERGRRTRSTRPPAGYRPGGVTLNGRTHASVVHGNPFGNQPSWLADRAGRPTIAHIDSNVRRLTSSWGARQAMTGPGVRLAGRRVCLASRSQPHSRILVPAPWKPGMNKARNRSIHERP